MRDMRVICDRKKLYKSGKVLVTAGIFALMMFGVTTASVSANTIAVDTNHSRTSAQINKSAVDKVNDDKTTLGAAKVVAVATTPATPVADKTVSAPAADKAVDTTSSTTPATDKAVDTTSSTTPATDKAVDTTPTTPAANKAVDTTPATAATDKAVATPATPAADKLANTTPATDKAVATTPATPVANKAADTSSIHDQPLDTNVPTDKSANLVSTTQKSTDNQQVKSTETSHLQEINGKTYFLDDNGQVKKNFTAIIDGKVLYFDKTSGELTANAPQVTKGLVNIDNAHNAAHDLTADNFTNVDGYLTANSWYRPKDILKNGTTWTPTTAEDFRPLLMSWWPDKNTQVAYLQYMQSVGMLPDDVKVSNDDNMSTLTDAAMTVQKNIESRIGVSGKTDWLKQDMNKLIDSQANWNIDSESKGNDHLQGGALLYVNDDKTPNANSDYRLLNRTPTNQTGQITDPSKQGGYEMLLANDVDNSNPVVQAEQLNWLHYMMNIGTIAQNDPTANFDGYRVDAVDNVDADLLQIAGDYFKAAYGTGKTEANANNHISILEDWDNNDSAYIKAHGNNQLTMDFPAHLALKYALNMPLAAQSGLEPLINTSLVKRGKDATENEAQPNYAFIRAHDSEVQTVIAQIIKDKINTKSDGLTVTPDEIKQAFTIYNADELKADKEYTAYNIPASYAVLLTNKDTVPRVYYGDLFSDDGQYMSQKSPYYDAITSLLKSRIKYVAGGQSMNMTYLHECFDPAKNETKPQGVLTSVRYGKGAMTADDLGNSDTRQQGIGLVINNKPFLNLNDDEQIVLNLGAAHKNQAYRPLMLTTKSGLQIYDKDAGAPVVYTNDAGQLIFKSDMVYGVSNPQVSGYFAAWVPVGASDSQDARTQSSQSETKDGDVYHSNAALDSNVIYEGFSNFQAMPEKNDDFTNVKIAQNAKLFKDLGITSFELAPQYRSSTDNSFLDSVIQNGYAFTDRYDVGYNTPTKYGTVDQLLDSLRALHAQGIQAINDWVPDQIYNLPGEQIVTAVRTNGSGKYDYDSVINNTLYDSRTVGGGEYQEKFGGLFLDQLKKDYPSLFETKQISTNQPMNPDVKIKEWSAKYFNGSNIQGRGAWYVLKDWATNQYFNVSSDNGFLPKQLLGEKTSTGFITENGKTSFYSTSGYQAKDTFIQDGTNWYYFDNAGYMLTGKQNIHDKNYYFLPNGVELQDAYLFDGNQEFYYNKAGEQVMNQYYQDSQNQWHYFFENGRMAIGLTEVPNADGTHVTQYFDANGVQIKGTAIKDKNNQLRYFDEATGNMVVNSWGQLADKSWLYLNSQGVAVTGNQKIDGEEYYFNADGKQVKGNAIIDNNGDQRYYDGDKGVMAVNSWGELPDGSWLYLNDKGIAVTGRQVINNQVNFFGNDGKQIKDAFKLLSDGSWVYLDDKGLITTGSKVINGLNMFFDKDGHQIKGDASTDANGKRHYYDKNDGHLVTNSWGELPDGSWLYLDEQGDAVTGQRVIDGKTRYFDEDGKQIKNSLKTLPNGDKIYLDGDGVAATGLQHVGDKIMYFDEDGKQVVGKFVSAKDGSWYYLNQDGVAAVGPSSINGQSLYFDQDGKQVKYNEVRNSDGTTNYYTGLTGEKLTQDFGELPDGSWIYLDAQGHTVTGAQIINGQNLYFKADGQQVKGHAYTDQLGHMRFYDPDSGDMLSNRFEQITPGVWAYFGADGVAITGQHDINGQKLFFDETGYQVKGSQRTIDGTLYSFDSQTGNQKRVQTTLLPQAGHYITKNGNDWQYDTNGELAKGLRQDSNGKLRYFDLTTGIQAKGQFVTIGQETYYFSKDHGDAQLLPMVTEGHYGTITLKQGQDTKTAWVYRDQNNTILKGLQNINGTLQFFDPYTGEQLKGGVAKYDDKLFYFESGKGNLVSTVAGDYQDGHYIAQDGQTRYADKQNQLVKGLVTVNGALQYFDNATGNQIKNQQVIVDGKTYYFDDKGNGEYLFTNTLDMSTNAFSTKNVAFNHDSSSFDHTVDGFLTADTWYRPKSILANGTTWRDSTDKDMRPLITVWWPNKNVQVNYLNFMKANGLLTTAAQYTLHSDQYDLNQAAQDVQVAIERRIASEHGTEWLQKLLFESQNNNPSFVKQQFIWNKDSEYHGGGDAWFQGGYLKYGNNPLTPTTNSDYRQPGNAFDFLLANDVDNSNPVVQAENLNWLHYLMNFGTITAGQDDANFDSIRIDAVDFIHNDTIQRTYDYLRDAYQVQQSEAKANQHISLVEAGLDAGTSTIHNDALIESNLREAATLSLTNEPGKNKPLTNMLQDVDGGTLITDHTQNSTENQATPNYSIIHAHDKGVQEKVGAAITDATGADWTNFTDEQLKAGLELFYKDQRATNKKYNSYNIPSIYALMLTNKDTVPRMYYGDMYQDDGQYMANKSIYYDALVSLMTARKSYVSGGQTMSVDNHGLLKSVRFGKDAMTANDLGTSATRTEGLGVIIGNDPKLQLNDSDKVTLDMGAAHKNQKYRAVILTTRDGLATFNSDQAPTAWTNDQGTLTFSNQEINGQDNTQIRGVANPQVSGYLAVWVPVGASDNQDARTAATTTENHDGKVLHSNAALDSNLIYEGFSNFQPKATTHDELTNVVIAKNADVFNNWGITSFEMAPQYRSSGDHTFLDSTIDNGYAFTDRYDLGFNTPTKYGTDGDLRAAIQALHHANMQVMADVVDNQVYNLPGKEVVSATRAGVYGNDDATGFGTQLYVTNSVGGGQYQEKYAGQYLEALKAKYPDLFEGKAYDYWYKNYANDGSNPYYTLSHGDRESIPADVAIKQWSAKYMNGTNVLGNGMGYVLKDWHNGQYFKLDGDKSTLPQI
ncbi:glycosyl hydrolase [Leuconostoc citreum]|uniref:glycoside hydrolase family 70 protein n=2 Tax=Leuconostoc citreum TaxID=33964 RepID=UPI00105EBBBC|nr:glycosyl hydrolase [Leuconostoc citreum]TPF02447.1 glycosyl hydrolase [Leuconostoc citreum]